MRIILLEFLFDDWKGFYVMRVETEYYGGSLLAFQVYRGYVYFEMLYMRALVYWLRGRFSR